MSEIVLRPYQEQFINDIRNEFKHNQRRVVGVAPCGAGKTIMTGWMIRQTMLNGNRAVFFVHRKELIEQTSATFTALGIEHGIIAAGFKPNYYPLVQIASVQTLTNRLALLNQPDLLVCDECHHILANSYKRIIDTWSDAFLLGVTATPERMGGKTLNDVFTSMVQAPSVSELIELGNLTRFKYFDMKISVVIKQLDKIQIDKGDYKISSLSVLMNDPAVIDAIVAGYVKNTSGKSAICYCVDVGHSKNVAEAFNKIGVPTAHCDGTTPKDERSQIIEDFRRGKYKILCNAELFGEGFDVPNCHAVILARPTKSLTLHIQQSMRSMRPDPSDPNKVAIIIDCVGNYERHGKPDDVHKWSLNPNEIKKPRNLSATGDGEAPDTTKTCLRCGHKTILRATTCPECGYKFYDEAVHDAEVNFVYSSDAGKQNAPMSNRIIRAPTKLEYYIGVAEERGYKKMWVYHQLKDDIKTFEELKEIEKALGYKRGWAYHKAEELGIVIPTKNGVEKNPNLG